MEGFFRDNSYTVIIAASVASSLLLIFLILAIICFIIKIKDNQIKELRVRRD